MENITDTKNYYRRTVIHTKLFDRVKLFDMLHYTNDIVNTHRLFWHI